MTTLENIGWLAVEIMKAKRSRLAAENTLACDKRRQALQRKMRALIDAELADREAVRQK